MLSHFSSFFIVLINFDLANALLRNVTVDDAATTGAIPHYLPDPSNWDQGANCPGCGSQPDRTQAFGQTWHDTTFHPALGTARAIELTFTGSAVYVFFILANEIAYVDTVTDMNFVIDGATVGNFLHSPTTSAEYDYNVPVYVNESLSLGQHQIRMEATGTRPTLIMFDYLLYTSDEDETTSAVSSSTILSSTVSFPTNVASTFISTPTPTPTSASASAFVPTASETQDKPSKSNLGAIIGGTVAGVLALSLLIGVLLYYWRQEKRGRRSGFGHVNTLLLSSSVQGNVGTGPITRSKGKAAVPSIPTTIPSTSKARAPNETTTLPAITNSTPFPQGEMSKQSNSTNDLEISRHERIEVPRPEILPRLDPGTNVLPSNSPLPGSQQINGRPADEARILRSQVELLMNEVVRLRQQQREEVESEAPPEYSEGRASPDRTHRR